MDPALSALDDIQDFLNGRRDSSSSLNTPNNWDMSASLRADISSILDQHSPSGGDESRHSLCCKHHTERPWIVSGGCGSGPSITRSHSCASPALLSFRLLWLDGAEVHKWALLVTLPGVGYGLRFDQPSPRLPSTARLSATPSQSVPSAASPTQLAITPSQPPPGPQLLTPASGGGQHSWVQVLRPSSTPPVPAPAPGQQGQQYKFSTQMNPLWMNQQNDDIWRRKERDEVARARKEKEMRSKQFFYLVYWSQDDTDPLCWTVSDCPDWPSWEVSQATPALQTEGVGPTTALELYGLECSRWTRFSPSLAIAVESGSYVLLRAEGVRRCPGFDAER
ncbi:hypothetical protein K466DRAFT_604956 [Polyporus arcularius HHB13444]|uniref:Uncharacterized protein n=1 Tax=Polyporus arcularius HHB13444 TaxID=1314778 RepID=A0A5C3NU92_9APHY|nr:hypothetical protein K466DRAFT_604956 [Polyporus arcularius HHB13444]